MPIKGLTTEVQIGSGLPQIARLYKGSEKPEDGRRPGKDLDYFRVEFEPQYEHLRPIWEEMYGEEPTEFEPVMLVAPTVDEAFSSWKEEWNASQTLLHRCDGESQVKWWSESNQMSMTAKKACEVNDKDHACGCKATGRLSIILPDFIAATGMLGYVSVSTHSLYDILTVHRYLSDIQRMMGRLTGIPFVFGRAAKEISAPKQVKRASGYVNEGRIKVTKSLFYLHVNSEFTQSTILPLITTAPTLPSLPAPQTPQIDVEEAKKKLGTGVASDRRMGGYVPDEAAVEADEVSEGEVVEDGVIQLGDPPPAYSYLNNLGRVYSKVQDLYTEDGKLNQFHMKGSIEKMGREGVLSPTMNIEEAAAVIRAKKTPVPLAKVSGDEIPWE